VMVAILLLSVSIVSIFGAQFSATASAEYAKHVSQAALLARCRMSELELYFQTEGGFEEGDITNSGECCEVLEGDKNAGLYTCRWEIKTIELPDLSQMMSGGGADGGILGDLSDMSGGDMSGGDMSGNGMSGNGMAEMGMGMVGQFLPMITNLLQQAIRRVTVTVEWKQGSRSKDLQVTQYVVHPTQGPLQLMQQVDMMNKMSGQGEFDMGGNGFSSGRTGRPGTGGRGFSPMNTSSSGGGR